jgi:hypothetical protein
VAVGARIPAIRHEDWIGENMEKEMEVRMDESEF